MAKHLYPKYKEAILSGASNTSLTSGDVKVVLIDNAHYTYSASHEFLSDIPTDARVAISPALTNKTVTDGVFDADDPEFVSLTGASIEQFVIMIDTGTPSTSRLVGRNDEAAGLPFTPSGGNLILRFDNGANKIFKI